MAAVALLSDPGPLEELSEALAQQPEPLIGLWIEGAAPCDGRRSRGSKDLISRLAAVQPLDLQLVRHSSRYSVCRIATLSQVTLLDLFVYLAGGNRTSVSGRFVPVFRADETAARRRAAWRELAERYPGLVLAPLVQDARGGLWCVDVSLQGSPGDAARELA